MVSGVARCVYVVPDRPPASCGCWGLPMGSFEGEGLAVAGLEGVLDLPVLTVLGSGCQETQRVVSGPWDRHVESAVT